MVSLILVGLGWVGTCQGATPPLTEASPAATSPAPADAPAAPAADVAAAPPAAKAPPAPGSAPVSGPATPAMTAPALQLPLAEGTPPACNVTRFQVTLFNPQCGEDSARLASQSKFMVALGISTAALLWAMPEEVTKWNKDEISQLEHKWRTHVGEGPVWDHDDWAINYIGHPVSGGLYYQIARNSGYRPIDAFTYSTLMSTFYWEYGFEAFAEIPSIQDLIVTPVVGSLYGEWAHAAQNRILANDGMAFGSHALGSVSLFLLDPIDHMASGVNRLVGRQWIRSGIVVPTTSAPLGLGIPRKQPYIGMTMVLGF